MANKVSKKEKKELDELEDELVFLSSKKKELEQSLLVLKSENDSKEESLESKLKDDYSSSVKSINGELASLTKQEEALMDSFSKLLDSFNDDSNDIKIYLSLLKGGNKDE